MDKNDRLFTTNPIMWINISYLPNHKYPDVEFQRVYCSNWYKLDTQERADKIQNIINQYSNDTDCLTHFINSNRIMISLAL